MHNETTIILCLVESYWESLIFGNSDSDFHQTKKSLFQNPIMIFVQHLHRFWIIQNHAIMKSKFENSSVHLRKKTVKRHSSLVFFMRTQKVLNETWTSQSPTTIDRPIKATQKDSIDSASAMLMEGVSQKII